MKQHHVESLAKEDYMAPYLEPFLQVDSKQGTSSWSSGEKKQEAEPTLKRHCIREASSIQVPQNIEFDCCSILKWDLHKCSKWKCCFFGRLWKFFWHNAYKVHELHKGCISISEHNVSVYWFWWLSSATVIHKKFINFTMDATPNQNLAYIFCQGSLYLNTITTTWR